jgi:hypothetical protein
MTEDYASTEDEDEPDHYEQAYSVPGPSTWKSEPNAYQDLLRSVLNLA